MTFSFTPAASGAGATVTITILKPADATQYPDGVEASAAMTIGIRGKENKCDEDSPGNLQVEIVAEIPVSGNKPVRRSPTLNIPVDEELMIGVAPSSASPILPPRCVPA